MDFFADAEQYLHEYLKNGQWDIYDGASVLQDATITVTDITLSVALNSRLDTRSKVWHIWQHKSQIDQALVVVSAQLTGVVR